MEYTNPNDAWLQREIDKELKDMSEDDLIKIGCLRSAILMALFFAALLICGLLVGCTTTKYVPVIEHRTDTVYKNMVKHDSIYVHDSTLVKINGDTVEINRWHTKYVKQLVHDTTYIAKHDTIPAPYPEEVIKEVPADLTWWQQTRLNIANILLWLLLIGSIMLGAKWWIEHKRP